MKPWQHRVEWPDRQVVLTAEGILATAERRRDGLYQLAGYILHRYDEGVLGYWATQLDSGGSILVTEAHDSGDEHP